MIRNTGVRIPVGANGKSGHSFNEYVVFNPAQILLRYLVLLKDKNFTSLSDAKINALPNLTSVAPSGGGQGPYTQGPMRVVYLNCLKQGLTIDDLIPAVEPEEGWFAVPPGRPAPLTPGGQHTWCQNGCQGRRGKRGSCSRCNKMKTKSKAQRKRAAAPY